MFLKLVQSGKDSSTRLLKWLIRAGVSNIWSAGQIQPMKPHDPACGSWMEPVYHMQRQSGTWAGPSTTGSAHGTGGQHEAQDLCNACAEPTLHAVSWNSMDKAMLKPVHKAVQQGATQCEPRANPLHRKQHPQHWIQPICTTYCPATGLVLPMVH